MITKINYYIFVVSMDQIEKKSVYNLHYYINYCNNPVIKKNFFL